MKCCLAFTNIKFINNRIMSFSRINKTEIEEYLYMLHLKRVESTEFIIEKA